MPRLRHSSGALGHPIIKYFPSIRAATSGCTSWEHRGVVWVKVQIIIRATAVEEKALRECVEEDAKERFQGTTVYNRQSKARWRKAGSREAVAGEAGETPGKEVSMEQMQ